MKKTATLEQAMSADHKKKMACGITPKKRIQGCKLAPEANLRWGEGLSEPPAVEVLTSIVDNFVHQSQHFL